MANSSLKQNLRLLPNLEDVRDTLRAREGELLESIMGSRAPAGRRSPLSMTESVARPGESESPDGDLIEQARRQEREQVLAAGRRGIERILDEGEDAALSPQEQFGVEAIVLLVGRPALLIQNGSFFPPPPEWQLLEQHRPAIEKLFRSVGRIEVEGHPDLEWIGTGFLVGADVVMTNRHVAAEFTAQRADGRWGIRPGMKAKIDFCEEIGAANPAEVPIRALIGIHNRYDMALFRLERPPGSAAPAQLRVLPKADRPQRLEGRNLYVVGYPAWDGRRNDPEPMRKIFGNIFNVKRLQPGTLQSFTSTENIFTHDCSTLGGNSGSCVVDLESHRVMGLHFGGRYRVANQAVALWQLGNDPLIRHAGIAID